MKNLSQSIRRIFSLLLCLIMLAGLLIPAASAEDNPAIVLTVYEQTEGAAAVPVKTYTAAQLDALKTTETYGYQFWKNGEEKLIAATQVVTLASLLADAQLTFVNGDTVKAADATDFSALLTYAENDTYKYYATASDMTEVPAALALCWASGSGTLEEVASGAVSTGSLRFCYGISAQQYTEQSAAGKRLVSGVTAVTLIHPAACSHPTTELQGAKPATCTEAGYTGDTVCTICGATVEEGTQIPVIACPCKDFIDTPAATNWAHAGLDFAVRDGLIKGVTDDRLDPSGTMTRAMLVTVLWRMAGEPAPKATNPFTDVPDGRWFTNAIAWAAEEGVVDGVGSGRFNPNGNVTREQIAVILFRYAQAKNLDTGGRSDTAFPDDNQVSRWACEALSWANYNGLISGSKVDNVSYLMPKSNATRAQVATIAMRFSKLFG